MEGLQEIDDAHRMMVEKEDEAYLKKVSLPENRNKKKELEEEYRAKLKTLLNNYHKNVSGFLGQKNVQLFEKNETPKDDEKKEELPSRLRVRPFSLDLNYREKSDIWWKVHSFSFKISLRNILHKIFPAKTVIFLLSVKLVILEAYIELKFYFLNLFRRIFMFFKNIFLNVKNFFVKFFSSLKKGLLWAIGKILFFRKKKEEGEKKNSEGSTEKDKAVSENEKKAEAPSK